MHCNKEFKSKADGLLHIGVVHSVVEKFLGPPEHTSRRKSREMSAAAEDTK